MRLNDPQTLEARTQAIGRNLYDRACSNGESLFSVEGWTARLIRWSVRHEEVGSNSFVSSTSSRRSRAIAKGSGICASTLTAAPIPSQA